MRVIMFQDRFAELVRTGAKYQTIRTTARCRVGDTLSLRRWTGKPYRSKQEILRDVVCAGIDTVRISNDGVDLGLWKLGNPDQFAKRDGFIDFGEMVLWFGMTHGLPFYGWLITWRAE